MSTMNQNQQRYAMKRVDEISRARESLLRESHTHKAKAVTVKEKLHAIRRGEVDTDITYQARQRITEKTTVISALDFSDFVPSDVFDEKAFRRDREKLRKEAAAVTDEIMLGDAAKAKSLLSKFESTV